MSAELVFDPPLDGRMVVAPDGVAARGRDFGNLVRKPPKAVLEAGSVLDVQRVVKRAGELGLKVMARGQGHGVWGQAQTEGGVVLDLSRLAQVEKLARGEVTVGAGTRWSQVVAGTVARGACPAVLTDYLDLSVGGTLSMGGCGSRSHSHGLQVDAVRGLEVVGGDGELRRCSASVEPDLFHACLGGVGQVGLIVSATMAVVPSRPMVREYTLWFDDPAQAFETMNRCVDEGRFEQVLMRAVSDGKDGWVYLLAVAYELDPRQPQRADHEPRLEGLTFKHPHDFWFNDQTIGPVDLPQLEFLHRYTRPMDEGLPPERTMPWLDVFVGGPNAVATIVETLRALAAEQYQGGVLLYPLRSGPWRSGLPKPPGETFYLFDLLRVAMGDEAAILARHQALYARLRGEGGVLYPISAVPMTRDDWRAHYGERWPVLERAKAKTDPRGVVGGGLGLF